MTPVGSELTGSGVEPEGFPCAHNDRAQYGAYRGSLSAVPSLVIPNPQPPYGVVSEGGGTLVGRIHQGGGGPCGAHQGLLARVRPNGRGVDVAPGSREVRLGVED